MVTRGGADGIAGVTDLDSTVAVGTKICLDHRQLLYCFLHCESPSACSCLSAQSASGESSYQPLAETPYSANVRLSSRRSSSRSADFDLIKIRAPKILSASTYSFDIYWRHDQQELVNAIDQTHF